MVVGFTTTCASCVVESRSWRGVLNTTLCDKSFSLSVVCGKTGRWFSLGTPLSSTSKTERNIVTEILLKQSGIKHHYHNPYL
jgi:hypothetical protein